MTDDLVKRLREAADDEHYWAECQDFWHEEILREAADRIEALTEQLEAATHDAKEAEAYAEELEAKVKNLTKHHSNTADPRYWEGRYRDEKAALAKAVGALRVLSCKCPSNCDWERDDVCTSWTARAALAEIEGGKTDG